MQFDRFLIAPLSSGLQTDKRPWQIMDDSFAKLKNAWIFRGRLRKRFGSDLLEGLQSQSRLRISLGTNTNMAINLPTGAQIALGQTFSLGTDFFNVYQLGAGVATLTTSNSVSAVINSTSSPNTITFTGGAASTIYWYPSLPVMGITQYETGPINDNPTYAFDTRYAYKYTAGSGWARSGSGTTPVWHGTDLNFFWSSNWQGSSSSTNTGTPVLFTTNFYAVNPTGSGNANDDPIWWTTDGSTWSSIATSVNNGFYFLPSSGSAFPNGPFILTSLIIVPFKNRLLLLNTIENSGTFQAGTNTQYKQRCRYSFNGSPFAPNAWYEPNTSDSSGNKAAGGGFIDASTEEAIVSAEFIKDRLIVYFERSTWEIAYTGNEVKPFVWQKFNTELGSQSTFSTVPFDREVLTIGNTGVHACNGSNVARIDQKIPNQIFDYFTARNSSPARTQGIRDYFVEAVYWTYVTQDQNLTNQKYPSQVLVYNYQNGSWAVNDDCFTAFGYLEQSTDMTWASSAPRTWAVSTFSWDSNIVAAEHRQIVAGTPEGFVLLVDPDVARNAPSMQITQLTISGNVVTLTVYNHNCFAGDFVAIENAVGISETVPQTIYQIQFITNANTIVIYTTNLTGTYKGGGTLARVSVLDIWSKEWNPYDKQDRNVFLHKIDFFVDKTANGEITVDYFPSSSSYSMLNSNTGAIMGTGVLETKAYNPIYYPFEQEQERLNHPIYFQTTGTSIQIRMYFTNAQASNTLIAWDDFELEGLTLYTQASADRMQ